MCHFAWLTSTGAGGQFLLTWSDTVIAVLHLEVQAALRQMRTIFLKWSEDISVRGRSWNTWIAKFAQHLEVANLMLKNIYFSCASHRLHHWTHAHRLPMMAPVMVLKCIQWSAHSSETSDELRIAMEFCRWGKYTQVIQRFKRSICLFPAGSWLHLVKETTLFLRFSRVFLFFCVQNRGNVWILLTQSIAWNQ